MKDPVTKDVRMIPPVCEVGQPPDHIISSNVWFISDFLHLSNTDRKTERNSSNTFRQRHWDRDSEHVAYMCSSLGHTHTSVIEWAA